MRAVIGAVVLVMAGAALGAQAPKAEPVYDVTFVVGPADQAASYTGTSTLNVDAKGVVSGKMAIVSPTTIRATLAGQIAKGMWTFDYTYDMPDQGCNTGTVKGTAKVTEDKKTISGAALIAGCSPEPMNGTFTFKLKEQ